MDRKRKRLLSIAVLSLVGFVSFGMVAGCSQEGNPYTAKPGENVGIGGAGGSGGGTTTDTSGTVSPGTSGGNTGAPPPPNAPAVDQMLDLACSKAASAGITGVDEEMALLCSGGKATAAMKALVGNAYAGSGTPKFAPVYVKSDKTAKTTQTLVDGADKFSMSLADVDKKREATLSMVITGDVNITYTIISTTPAVDAQHLECYKTDQKIVTTVAGIPMTTEIVQKQCYIRLSKAPDPEIMLVYGVLVPDDPVNVSGKNAGDEQITFEIQTAATTTYCIQAQHLLVNNMGFAALAEQKIQAQPPVVAAKFYSVVTGQ